MDKSFEITVGFEQRAGNHWPIVKTVFIRPDGYRFRLPLLLDTGADILVLHPRFEPMFSGLTPEKFKGLGGGECDGKKTLGRIELFGRTLDCEIGFVEFENLSWKAGFLGRECLTTFGIGFWESEREFYVTLTP